VSDAVLVGLALLCAAPLVVRFVEDRRLARRQGSRNDSTRDLARRFHLTPYALWQVQSAVDDGRRVGPKALRPAAVAYAELRLQRGLTWHRHPRSYALALVSYAVFVAVMGYQEPATLGGLVVWPIVLVLQYQQRTAAQRALVANAPATDDEFDTADGR
jgi:hypothetical protein